MRLLFFVVGLVFLSVPNAVGSTDGRQLISAVSFRTKDQRDAQLTMVRELADGGKTLILGGTVKIAGDSQTWKLRRVWRKHPS
jgi:hypothetical protein